MISPTQIIRLTGVKYVDLEDFGQVLVQISQIFTRLLTFCLNWEVKKRLSKFHYIFLNFPFQTKQSSLVFPLVRRTLPFDFNLSELESRSRQGLPAIKSILCGYRHWHRQFDVFIGLNKNSHP